MQRPLFLCLGAFGLSLVTPVLAETGGCSAGGGGDRIAFLPGRDVPALHGTASRDLRLWTADGRTIPFQVDACDEADQVVLDLSGGVEPERLGPTSVVLFRPRDAAIERASTVPPGAVELEVRTRGGATRWAYLGVPPSPLERSPVDYVAYDYDRSAIHAERYELRFSGAYVDRFALPAADGKRGEDLLDRLKARVTAQFLWGLVTFRRNEEEVFGKITGYRDGPIRAVMRTRLRVDVGWGLPVPEIVSDNLFYAEHSEGPITITLPFSLGLVFGDLDVRTYLDFLALDGFAVRSGDLPPHELRVGDRVTLDDPPRADWFALHDDDIVLFHRLRLAGELESVDVHSSTSTTRNGVIRPRKNPAPVPRSATASPTGAASDGAVTRSGWTCSWPTPKDAGRCEIFFARPVGESRSSSTHRVNGIDADRDDGALLGERIRVRRNKGG